MQKLMKSKIEAFIFDEAGQGITEYGAILGFVSCLIGLVYAMQNYWWPGNHSLRFNLRLIFENVVRKLGAMVGLQH